MNANVAELASRGEAGLSWCHAACDEELCLTVEMELHLIAHLALESRAAHDRAEPMPNLDEHRSEPLGPSTPQCAGLPLDRQVETQVSAGLLHNEIPIRLPATHAVIARHTIYEVMKTAVID